MNIKISKHAADRMIERGISKEEIVFIFNSESWDSVACSDQDDDILIAVKSVNGKKWRFIFNEKTGVLITCFPMR